MITNGYATLAELKEWLGFDDAADDTILERAINASSRMIERYTNDKFWLDATAVARTFPATNTGSVSINSLGALSPTVKIDSSADGTFATTFAATDFVLTPENAIAQGRPVWQLDAVGSYSFPVGGRRSGVQVTGKWGWPAIPDDVNQACLMQAARYVKRRHSIEGAAGFNDFGLIRLTADSDVGEILDGYRLVTVR